MELTATEAKSFLKSKTIFGLLVTAVGLLGQNLLGVSVDEATGQEVANGLVDVVCLGLEAVGLVIAAWGRFRASGPLVVKADKTTAAGLLLALLLCAGPAWADGGEGQSLTALSLWAYALNLVYALGAFAMVLGFWFGIVDRYVLKGFDTREAVAKGNLAVAQFAGLSLIALALVIGLSLG